LYTRFTMRIAIYARVSTSKQDAENQLTQLREFAMRQGWEITTEYIDVVSGSGKKERPRFLAMMHDASQHKFNLLLFWSLDRLSREGIVRTLSYLQQLKHWQIGWRSYTQPFLDTGNPMVTDIVLSVLAAVAQQERVTISERTLAGLRRARKAGKTLGRPRTQLNLGVVRAKIAAGESLRSVARSLDVSPALLCNRLGKN
jgi:DNA invertase Pin-like site-specific DNA recombinase